MLKSNNTQMRFPNRRVPDRCVFVRFPRVTLSFPIIAEREPDNVYQDEMMLEMVERSPSSVRRIYSQTGVTGMKNWRTLHNFSLYPYHLRV